jgi:hypothetical protein
MSVRNAGQSFVAAAGGGGGGGAATSLANGCTLDGTLVVGAGKSIVVQSTGYITLPDGTAALPPLRWTTNPDVGWYFGSAAIHAAFDGADVQLLEAARVVAAAKKGAVVGAQQNLANTDAIQPNAFIIPINASSGSSTTMISTPTIAAGFDGQEILLVYVGATANVILQDENALAGSTLRLGSNTSKTLNLRDSIGFTYLSSLGLWLNTAGIISM